MASKSAKSGGKKDDSAASLTVEAISTLLNQLREEIAAEFKSSFGTLEEKLDHIQSKVEDHGQRLPSLELATEDLSQRVSELETICSSLSENNSKLMAKIADLEGQSRRQNIRILGLSESIERGGPTDFFSNVGI